MSTKNNQKRRKTVNPEEVHHSDSDSDSQTYDDYRDTDHLNTDFTLAKSVLLNKSKKKVQIHIGSGGIADGKRARTRTPGQTTIDFFIHHSGKTSQPYWIKIKKLLAMETLTVSQKQEIIEAYNKYTKFMMPTDTSAAAEQDDTNNSGNTEDSAIVLD